MVFLHQTRLLPTLRLHNTPSFNQNGDMAHCTLELQASVIFVRAEVCVKKHNLIQSVIMVLQSRPGFHIMLYTLKKIIKMNISSLSSPERIPYVTSRAGSYRRLWFINTSIMAEPLAIRNVFKTEHTHLHQRVYMCSTHLPLHLNQHTQWHSVGCIF